MVSNSLGLFILRVSVGLMLAIVHGLPKLTNFSAKAEIFPDPLGVGSFVSLCLAVFAEFFCALAVAFGFLTRLAAIPLVINMLVIAIVLHGDDPWGKKEFALLYAIPFLTLIFTGAGSFSLDGLIFKKKEPSLQQ